MRKNPFVRLYKISIPSAIFISLPVFVLIAWIIFSSFLDFKRYMSRVDEINPYAAIPLTTDTMHLYIRNRLKRIFIRTTAPDMPKNDNLDIFQIAIDPESLSELNSNLPKSGKTKYHTAYIKYKNRSYKVKLRYVGDNNWHWLYPKKSFKIKTKRTKLIEGQRRINIKIPRWLWLLNEPVSSDLARECGLVAPRVFPLKLVLNNVYMGLYFFQDPIDESVLRRYNLMPGSVYSGDFAAKDPITGVSTLWKDSRRWEKDASRSSEQKDYRKDIQSLIFAVNNMDLKTFYKYCEDHIDNKNYATYISLDNIIGCQHHDFAHNHKIYFDPYKGKFVPIYWDVGELGIASPKFDIIGNPLFNKWRLIPEFDLHRKRTLYKLMNIGPLNFKNIIKHIDKYDKLVRLALKADMFRVYVNRKRSHILHFPASSPSEPFFMNEYYKMVVNFKAQVKKRYNLVENYLNKEELLFKVEDRNKIKVLKILSKGNVGSIIKKIKVNCSAKSIEIYRDLNRNSILDENDLLLSRITPKHGKGIFSLNEKILPGYKKLRRPDKGVLLAGRFELGLSPLEYIYFVKADGKIRNNIQIVSENAVTGRTSECIKFSYDFSITERTISLHPWDLDLKPLKRDVYLGPGKVILKNSIIYPENVTLHILPGTEILIGKNSSIFCYGKVIAKGTEKEPIIFRALNKLDPWGGFVLQGKGTSNSIFEYCRWENGSIPEKNLIDYTSMVSIHDTSNVKMSYCYFGENHIGDDSLHFAYTTGVVDHCVFYNARSDAIDIDISKVDIKFSYFINSGNDALDFMTSTNCNVEFNYFYITGDKGISVGEKSSIRVENNIFENCNIGVEIKDQSCVDFKINFIKNSNIAINLYKKNWRYEGGGILNANIIYTNECKKQVISDKYSKANYIHIRNRKPTSDYSKKIFSVIEIDKLKRIHNES